MNQFSSFGAWRDAFLQSVLEIGIQVAAFVPSLVVALLIVLFGWMLSRALELAVGRLLQLFGLDRVARRLRLADVLERAGVQTTLSLVVARTLFWILMLSFLLFGAQTLGINVVSATIDRLVRFIPDILGAVLILLLGLLVARFAGTVVSSGAIAAGYPSGTRLGFFVRVIASGLVLIVALEQLGVATNIFVGPFTVILAAVGLSAGLAFALGAYPIVTHILAGHFLKQSLPRDVFVEVDGRRGTVDRIGATDTLFRCGEESWSIPNAKLLDLIVNR